MMANQSLLTSPPKRKISLTALIDVVFILLMFFMLTASFSEYSKLTLNTPTASTNTINNASPQLLRLSADGTITLTGGQSAQLNLSEAISRLNLASPVILLPHADANLQTILSVLEALKAAGAEQMTLGEAWGVEGG